MRRDLYTIPDNLDVDKIKQSRMAYFADRTAVHIKNGLTEVQLNPIEGGVSASQGQTKQMLVNTNGSERNTQHVTTNIKTQVRSQSIHNQGRMSKESRKEIFKQLMTV